jgi:hypothetical protein
MMLFAFYGGPDQLMPITSGLAAILAFLLMFWNKVMGFLGRLFHRSKPEPVSEPRPHNASSDESNQISVTTGSDNT